MPTSKPPSHGLKITIRKRLPESFHTTKTRSCHRLRRSLDWRNLYGGHGTKCVVMPTLIGPLSPAIKEIETAIGNACK
jgi:hypothetical protein